MLLVIFMDMAPLTLLPNLQLLHPLTYQVLPLVICDFLSSSVSPKILYDLKGKSAIISKPTPIVQTFVIDPTSKLGGPKPKPNIIE